MEAERLIEEIEARPGLYDKNSSDYANKQIKDALWMDVTRTLSEDWDDMSEIERSVQCKEVQLKWKHIRDNFRRELLAQKKGNQGGKKKRKYKHFDQLLFLIQHVNDGIAGNCNTTESIDYDLKQEDQELIEIEIDSPPSVDRSPPRNTYSRNKYAPKPFATSIIRPWRRKKTTFEEQVLKSLKNRDSLETDGDRTFCLSLVSSMKKMDEASKLNAKIDILKIIRQYSFPQADANPLDPLSNQNSYKEEKTDKKT